MFDSQNANIYGINYS